MEFIKRNQAIELINLNVLQNIQSKWNLTSCKVKMHPQYHGCQNLIYYLNDDISEYVLRISFREDRNLHQIQAEIHFVNYLHNNGASVAYPIKSVNDCFVELIELKGHTFYGVLFIKAKGIRLPDNNYRYREGVSLNEYFHNYGKTIGIMHRLAKDYTPLSDKIIRHGKLDKISNILIPKYLPKEKKLVNSKFNMLIKKAQQLPKDKGSYGLIHADFSDGNSVIDYDNGNITAFDFDDSAYCWFMYDIADAWTKGTGWAMFADTIEKRKNRMDNWYNRVLEGYFTENTLGNEWLTKLPFFIKTIEMEWLIGEYQYAASSGKKIEYNEEMLFKILCIEQDIPYLGMFDKIYNHKHPFCLVE